MKHLLDMSLEDLWQLFPIALEKHNPEYALWYSEEANLLLSVLRGHNVQRINHIGSTAVEGLVAKPTIDILLELPEIFNVHAVADLLKKKGWLLMALNNEERTLSLNKGYTPEGFADRVFHLHVRPLGDWSELYFRDYLRDNPHSAQEYAELKQHLEKTFTHDRDGYTQAKSNFVTLYSKNAREAYPQRYSISQ